MEYSTEDSQNAAPGSVQAAKLNASRKGPDSQSVTKRYVSFCPKLAYEACQRLISNLPQTTDRADAAHDLPGARRLCLPLCRR
jgi:hypothetical protein